MSIFRTASLAVIALVATMPAHAQTTHAQTAPADPRLEIPSTVSPTARAQLGYVYGLVKKIGAGPTPTTPAEWEKKAAQTDAVMIPLIKPFVAATGVAVTEDTLGGVPVLRIRPAGYAPSGRVLIYVHGGAYTALSARSTLVVPALMAAAAGDEVISIDYTLAPRGTWKTATDQVIAVWQALLAKGQKPAATGMFGDSAGGGLAAGSVLKMRDKGVALPAALVLLSPWSDITATGDTYTTLAAFDPTLSSDMLKPSADAYAAPADQKNPYVSPVYGDYTKPFPATLIQVGTREIFLSNAVRHYQAITGGGNAAVLDVYEGMPHVWQGLTPDAPETKKAMKTAAAFFHGHLGAR